MIKMWEDEQNKGGKYFQCDYQIKSDLETFSQLANAHWKKLALCTMGGTIPNGEYINGIRFVDKTNFERGKIIWNKKCTMVMLGLVIIVCGTSLLAVNSQRKINNNTVTRTAYYDVESYCNSHPNNFYFTDVYSITNYEGGYRYQFFNDNTYMNFVSLGDWQGFTPLFWEKLKNRGIDDVQNAIYEKDNVFVIASEDRNVDFISELKDNVECNVEIRTMYIV